ncbi:hypothetical protein [Paraburkholderia diazotrophica]|uniref:Uncharacterized protein n=1 Tax=Paraburkholderia diazotrophica TaxID=667676 RepID=A0A1H7DLA8_9BURK|nr:hypothetical protein [Paraburkholderia diazotrophica]SEK02591.1 hypothetical protein SAMN05192539_103185 [Paraburkholderia diazotrophica]
MNMPGPCNSHNAISAEWVHRTRLSRLFKPNYLSVKVLWATLAGRVPAFLDRELFLSYMRSYIYDDPNLVLVLLSEEADEVRTSEAIANYIYGRFGSLLDESNDLAESVAMWEEACAHGLPVEEAIGADNRQSWIATEQLLALSSDIHDEGRLSKFAAHAFMTLEERKYLTMGSVAALAKAGPPGTRIESVDAPLIRYELESDLPYGEHEGSLMVVLPSSSQYVAVVFVSEMHRYLVRSFGDIDQAELQRVFRYAVNQTISANVHRDLEDALENAKDDPRLRMFFEHNKLNCLRAATKTYGTLATLQASEGPSTMSCVG